MKTMNTLQSILMTALVTMLFSCSSAGKPLIDPATIEHSNHQPPPNVSSAELNRIKRLAGKWKSTTSMFGEKDQEVFTEFSVTAGGSAVMEKIFPGTPHEMISVYFDDDDGKLAMTHYCIMRNRPHFTLAESDKNNLKLDVTEVKGLISADAPSMGAITLHFEDENHFTSTCEGGGAASEKQPPMMMRYSRVE